MGRNDEIHEDQKPESNLEGRVIENDQIEAWELAVAEFQAAAPSTDQEKDAASVDLSHALGAIGGIENRLSGQQKAGLICEKAVDLFHSSEALEVLANSLRRSGEIELAIEPLEMVRIIASCERDYDYGALVFATDELGDIQFELEKFEISVELWEEISDEIDLYFRHRNKLGRAYFAIGSFQEALVQFEKCLGRFDKDRRFVSEEQLVKEAEVLVQIASVERELGIAEYAVHFDQAATIYCDVARKNEEANYLVPRRRQLMTPRKYS